MIELCSFSSCVLCSLFSVSCPWSYVLCPLSSCYFLYSVLCPLVTPCTLSFVLLLLLVLCPLFLCPLVTSLVTLSSVLCPLVTPRTLSSVLLLLLVLCPLSSCYFSSSVLYPPVTSCTPSSVFLPVPISTSLLLGVGAGSADLQDEQEEVYGSMDIDYRGVSNQLTVHTINVTNCPQSHCY